MNWIKAEMAEVTNPADTRGTLADAMRGADVFIGVSAPGAVTPDMVRSMAKDPILFACANPTPEIFPDEALSAGAKVVATGRSDFPNQINNVLAFPGLFRGLLDTGITNISVELLRAAATGIAGVIDDDEIRPVYIIPGAFDTRVASAVAKAVRKFAGQ